MPSTVGAFFCPRVPDGGPDDAIDLVVKLMAKAAEGLHGCAGAMSFRRTVTRLREPS